MKTESLGDKRRRKLNKSLADLVNQEAVQPIESELRGDLPEGLYFVTFNQDSRTYELCFLREINSVRREVDTIYTFPREPKALVSFNGQIVYPSHTWDEYTIWNTSNELLVSAKERIRSVAVYDGKLVFPQKNKIVDEDMNTVLELGQNFTFAAVVSDGHSLFCSAYDKGRNKSSVYRWTPKIPEAQHIGDFGHYVPTLATSPGKGGIFITHNSEIINKNKVVGRRLIHVTVLCETPDRQIYDAGNYGVYRTRCETGALVNQQLTDVLTLAMCYQTLKEK